MADKKDLDPNHPAEDGTFLCPVKKRAIAERSLTGFGRAHEPEFKKQRLEQLQRKAYHSVLLASKSESSGTSHEKNASWMIPNSLPNPESLVGKRVHARSPDDEDDDSPTNKKIKLHKQAYDHVLHAFNAESPALSHSRTLIMQHLLDECNNKAHINKIVEPRSRLLPEGLHFRPTDLEMAMFLKQKALGQPIEACIIPEERHDIFSIPPRDLPGYPEETHWYYYCWKSTGQQDPRSLWTRFREDTAVFDEEENCVAIKRRFTLVEQEEECNDVFLPDEEEPPVEEWFIKEISLPPSVADSEFVLCHVVLKKREKMKEEEEYYEEEEEEED
ncbi:BnaA09g35990D [Brassica napus]|uniref:BnaA09g35990D protein n=1 Tax=Brassica napus TaxID=3708 RepID=A0A078GRD2_BRANA|nr:BnaA09g35990D [Brassica napus]